MRQDKYCKYHSYVPAKRYCPGCKISLCSHCVAENRQTSKTIVCPACDKAMRKLSTAHAIPPFWKRMPSVFLYPLNPGSLVQLSGISVFSLLMLVSLWPVVLVAAIMLPMMLLRYSFSVLQHTAAGHLSPPAITLNFQLRELSLPLKLIGVMMLLSLLMGIILFPFGASQATIQLIAFVLNQVLLPAMVVLLAVHNSFIRAINPVDIGSVIATIGLPYLALCGVLLLLGGAPATVQYFFVNSFPPWMLIMLSVFIMSYFTVVMFHLLGYVVFQHHEQLGIRPEVEYDVQLKPTKGKASAEAEQTPSYPLLQKIQLLIKEGRPQAAKAILSKELKHSVEVDKARIEMHRLYHQMLLSNDNEHEAMLEHAKTFIPTLLDHNMGKQALGVFWDCIKLKPGFNLTTPEDIHKLAKSAHKADEHKVLLALANGFVQQYPDYPNGIDMLLMAAQVLQHHLGQYEKARKVLNYVINRYPEDSRTNQARRELKLLEHSAEATAQA